MRDGRVDLPGVDLSGADLDGVTLAGANLIGATLVGTNLARAELGGALFGRANLTEALLVDANLIGANLIMANLTGADLTGANLGTSNLSRADLSTANLSKAELREASVEKANLIGSNLAGARLDKTDFTGADLAKANLAGALFMGANLTGANLEGANLTGAILHRSLVLGPDTRSVSGVPLSDSLGFSPQERDSFVRIETADLGHNVDPRVVAEFLVAVSALAELSARVGADVAQRLRGPDESGGPLLVAVRMSGSGRPIRLRRAHFGSPGAVDLVDFARAALPWFSASGGGGYALKLVGGARIAAAVTWLALPSQRAVTRADNEAKIAERLADGEEARLRRDVAVRKRESLYVDPLTPTEFRERLIEAGLQGAELDRMILELAPLFRRRFTLTTDVEDLGGDSPDDPPPTAQAG